MTFTYDYMPSQFIVFRAEEAYRYSDLPYWTGRGGVTPPGGNNGNPADYQCAQGGDSGFGYVSTTTTLATDGAAPVTSGQAGLPLAEANCANEGLSNGYLAGDTRAIWWPDQMCIRDSSSRMQDLQLA